MTLHVDTDPARLDRAMIHAFLAHEAPWSRGIPRATVERALDGSLCFGAYASPQAAAPQVGFARVVTDRATFAYLCDVFTLPHWRGRGVARALLQAIHIHPALQGLRRFLLFTRDAHGLYGRFGFAPLQQPARAMERHVPDLYTRSSAATEDR